MRPYVEDLARIADTYVSCHPNAGLPNAFGEHDELPADTSRYLARVRRSGLVNVVGGCCGTTPEHVSGDSRPDRGAVAQTRSRATARLPALQRPRAVRDRARDRLRDDRRAHERDRLRALPPADRGGRLHGRRRGRARAGPGRREPDRRQHGRRPARRRGGDDDLPERDRDRAGDRPGADHGRQLALLGDRGRAEVHPGEGDRQLDQPQGGRGGVPRPGARDPAARARRRS